MSHRAKHRHTALLRRITANRKNKSDLTPEGKKRWAAAKKELTPKKPKVDNP